MIPMFLIFLSIWMRGSVAVAGAVGALLYRKQFADYQKCWWLWLFCGTPKPEVQWKNAASLCVGALCLLDFFGHRVYKALAYGESLLIDKTVFDFAWTNTGLILGLMFVYMAGSAALEKQKRFRDVRRLSVASILIGFIFAAWYASGHTLKLGG